MIKHLQPFITPLCDKGGKSISVSYKNKYLWSTIKIKATT